ncbi:MAG: hypothetical protein IPP17_29815 [Bacteroidetes bacterium]|nr:hypothetical protein [Bacteroidota bacterium]
MDSKLGGYSGSASCNRAVNAIEWKATWRLEHAKAKVILTAEQQMTIFLEEFHLKWRLP